MTPPISPLTEEQKEAVARYRDTLSEIVFMAATRYQHELEKKGIPPEHIAGPILAGLYGAAERYLRVGGAEELAQRLHDAVQAAAREFHFEVTEIN
jgi:hypothetical protein